MAESKSAALPLGDAPMHLSRGCYSRLKSEEQSLGEKDFSRQLPQLSPKINKVFIAKRCGILGVTKSHGFGQIGFGM
jgi:hypothetical protein